MRFCCAVGKNKTAEARRRRVFLMLRASAVSLIEFHFGKKRCLFSSHHSLLASRASLSTSSCLGLAVFRRFLVQQIVDEALDPLQVNIRRKRDNYLVVNNSFSNTFNIFENVSFFTPVSRLNSESLKSLSSSYLFIHLKCDFCKRSIEAV